MQELVLVTTAVGMHCITVENEHASGGIGCPDVTLGSSRTLLRRPLEQMEPSEETRSLGGMSSAAPDTLTVLTARYQRTASAI